MKRLITLLLCISVVCSCATFLSSAQTFNDMTKESFTASDSTVLPYRLALPEYYDDLYEEYPLIIQLHGAGERGDDNSRQLGGADLVKRILQDDNYECIVVAPQCGVDYRWVEWLGVNGNYNSDNIEMSKYLTAVIELIDYIKENYAVDHDRVYVTGLSMGGFGTWDIITRYPRTFAAAIPVCGGGDPNKASRLKNIAIRTYHSADDPTVPVTCTRAMVKAIEAIGGNIEYTEYTDLGHGSWGAAYAVSDQMEWLCSQSRPEGFMFHGDINLDDSVTAADALLALQAAVGKIRLWYEDADAADIDENGSVSASDALEILQYAVGKIKNLD